MKIHSFHELLHPTVRLSRGPEPVCRAFRELFHASRPSEHFRRILDTAHRLPPHMSLCDTVTAGPYPYHHGNVFQHVARCMDACAGDPLAVWLAMSHDAGKLVTPQDILPHHYGHDAFGVPIVRQWAHWLALPEQWTEAGVFACTEHMRAGRYAILRPVKRMRLLLDIEERGLWPSFWKLVDADSKTDISRYAARELRILRETDVQGLRQDAVIHTRVAALKQANVLADWVEPVYEA